MIADDEHEHAHTHDQPQEAAPALPVPPGPEVPLNAHKTSWSAPRAPGSETQVAALAPTLATSAAPAYMSATPGGSVATPAEQRDEGPRRNLKRGRQRLPRWAKKGGAAAGAFVLLFVAIGLAVQHNAYSFTGARSVSLDMAKEAMPAAGINPKYVHACDDQTADHHFEQGADSMPSWVKQDESFDCGDTLGVSFDLLTLRGKPTREDFAQEGYWADGWALLRGDQILIADSYAGDDGHELVKRLANKCGCGSILRMATDNPEWN